MANVQDRLYIDEKDKEVAKKLENENYFNFNNKTRKEQFMFAMAIGVNSDFDPNLFQIERRQEWFFTKNLQPEDEAIIYSCAIHKEKLVDVINDLNKVYNIVQNYAHIGFKILSDKINNNSFSSLEKEFEREITDIYNNISFIE